MKNKVKQREYAQRHYARNKPRMKARAVLHTRKQREFLRAEISQAKARPCADCGGQFPPVAMDFDHVRGDKHCNVADLISRSVSASTLRAEIAKCDVVCANCHRVRTSRRQPDPQGDSS